jgi:Protein of unknown function (DUF2786)
MERIMTNTREEMIEKIRALMAKTVDRGCTEPEALAALDKARACMDAYEVGEDELRLTKEEVAILRSEPPGSTDANNIKLYLATSIAEFCDCQGWKGRDGIVFCGLPSDARLATWLLDSLTVFVRAELARHLIGCLAPKSERRFIINGFVSGCCDRISERLDALCTKSAAVATSNKRALVVVKDAAIKAKMEEEGICLRTICSSRREDNGAYRAGASAGDRASFARPVTGAGAVPRLR